MRFFPVTVFASIMGLTGLAIAFMRAATFYPSLSQLAWIGKRAIVIGIYVIPYNLQSLLGKDFAISR